MYVSTERPWFTFLVHPRNVHDLDTIRAAAFLRRYCDTEEEYVARACTLDPLVLGDVVFGSAAIRGEIVCVVRMPDRVVSRDGRRDIIAGAKLAADRGTRIIGLGALTAPASVHGRRLLPELPPDVAVTTGNGYTAAVTRDNVLEAAALLGLDDRAKVGILGATGSVGVAVSRLLVDDGFRTVLVGRKQSRVSRLLGDLDGRAELSTNLAGIADADVVVTLTNHETALLRPEHVKPGAVIVDVAQPANVEATALPAFNRRGVTVARGALVRIPGYMCMQDFTLPSPHDTFACLAETYLLAKSGCFQNSVGRPEPEYARRLATLAAHERVAARPIVLDFEAQATRTLGSDEGAGGTVAGGPERVAVPAGTAPKTKE